ncbi:MAG: SEC-C domain-containing protein [Planctomycetaceae bacterium]|nr:SEC-C domain-containing protein [Planctomycetaceae bacterium]
MHIFDSQSLQNSLQKMFAPVLGDIDTVERETHELRQSVQKGFVNKRIQLLDKLAKLVLVYANAMRFDDAINVLKEIIEIGHILVSTGETKDFGRLTLQIGQVITATYLLPNMTGSVYERAADVFDTYDQWVKLVPEDEFDKIKNKWAVENFHYIEHLIDQKKFETALDLTKSTLAKIDSPQQSLSDDFNELKPLIDGYYLRAKLYKELGENETALQDFLKYEELADKAHDIATRNKLNVPANINKISDSVTAVVIGGPGLPDMSTFMASQGFEDNRYRATLYTGDLYAQKNEYVTALRYYDKAARVAKIAADLDTIPIAKPDEEVQLSKIIVPVRKARMFADSGNLEGARKQILNAVREIKFKLKDCDTVEGVLKELCGDVKKLQKKVGGIPDEEVDLIEEHSQTGQPRDKYGIFKGDINWGRLHQSLGEKHNEACELVKRGRYELMHNRFKSSIVYLLQARNILDSLFISIELVSSHANLATTCSMLARAYLALHDFEKAERWFGKAVTEIEVVLDKVTELENKKHKDKREQYEYELLAPVDAEMILLLTLESQASLYISTNRFEKAIDVLIRSHKTGKNWSRKQKPTNKSKEANDPQSRQLYALRVMKEIEDVRAIQECYCHLGRFDDAIKWGNTEVDEYYELCNFLSEKENPSVTFRSMADYSLAALLVSAKRFDQADAMIQKLAQRFVERGVEKTIEPALERVEMQVAIRRCMLMSELEFSTERKILIEARQDMKKNTGKAIELFKDVLGRLEERRRNADNDHNIVRKQWDLLIKYTKTALDNCNGNTKEWDTLLNKRREIVSQLDLSNIDRRDVDLELVVARLQDVYILFDRIPEREPDNIDAEIAKHDLDFVGPYDNPVAPEFDIIKEGATKEQCENIEHLRKIFASRDFSKLHDELAKKPAAGRNDPCPCGSGKKYKRCCMEKDKI